MAGLASLFVLPTMQLTKNVQNVMRMSFSSPFPEFHWSIPFAFGFLHHGQAFISKQACFCWSLSSSWASFRIYQTRAWASSNWGPKRKSLFTNPNGFCFGLATDAPIWVWLIIIFIPHVPVFYSGLNGSIPGCIACLKYHPCVLCKGWRKISGF